MSKGIAWLAGEASGDYIASLVLPHIQAAYPEERMFGIGGEKMRAAGLEVWHPSSRLAVRGYVEVLRRLPGLIMLQKEMKRRVLEINPRAFIGVDAPDFNLAIEGFLRERGIKTIHFVCPSIWAWRPERIETIKKAVDHMLLVFPFEKTLMDEARVESTYIGHPLAGIIPVEPDKEAARERLKLETAGPLFAVMPGSREAEVAGCAPRFFAACEKVLHFDAKAQFVIPAADSERRAQIEALLMGYPHLKNSTTVVDGQSHAVMEASDAVLLASGTAALEAALFKRPMVVGYSMPALTGMMMQKKGIINYVSLPNILAGELLVPELLQYFCRPEPLAYALWNAYEKRNDARLMGHFYAMHESLLRDTPTLATEAIRGVCG